MRTSSHKWSRNLGGKMVDFKIAEKFLTVLLSPESRPFIDKIFTDYKANSLMAFQQGMNTMQTHLFDEEDQPERATTVVHGFLAGLFFGAMTEHPDPEVKKILFDDWFEQHARAKGEHIIDFAQAKIDKRS